MERVVSIVCECNDWVRYDTAISKRSPFVCPECGRIYTYDGRIIEPDSEEDGD